MNRSARFFGLLTLFLASGLWERQASAFPVLDQSFTNENGAANFQVFAQTFTAGLTGDIVSVSVGTFTNQTSATVQILGTLPDGTPDINQVLGSVAAGPLPAPALPGKTIDFSSSPVSVSAGDLLAIAVLSPGGVNNWAAGFSSDGLLYSSGKGYRGILQSGNLIGYSELFVFSDNQRVDFWFQTFVEQNSAVLPEPATITLLGFGLAGLGLAARWRGRRQGAAA